MKGLRLLSVFFITKYPCPVHLSSRETKLRVLVLTVEQISSNPKMARIGDLLNTKLGLFQVSYPSGLTL